MEQILLLYVLHVKLTIFNKMDFAKFVPQYAKIVPIYRIALLVLTLLTLLMVLWTIKCVLFVDCLLRIVYFAPVRVSALIAPMGLFREQAVFIMLNLDCI